MRKLVGTGQGVRRAQILLKADADGPGWTDERIAGVYTCRRQTVENVRRAVRRGRLRRRSGAQEAGGGRRLLDGAAEAEVIALRLGPPCDHRPTGRGGPRGRSARP